MAIAVEKVSAAEGATAEMIKLRAEVSGRHPPEARRGDELCGSSRHSTPPVLVNCRLWEETPVEVRPHDNFRAGAVNPHIKEGGKMLRTGRLGWSCQPDSMAIESKGRQE